MRLKDKIQNKPKLVIGLGGNYYIVSKDNAALSNICETINKAKSAIYYSKKYNCWTIRIKSTIHKRKVQQLFN